VNDELGRIWKEAVVASCRLFSYNSPIRTDKLHKRPVMTGALWDVIPNRKQV
jgi:hypothetical protein